MEKPDEKIPADAESRDKKPENTDTREKRHAADRKKSAIKLIGIVVLVLAVALAAIFVFPRAVMAPEPEPSETLTVSSVSETINAEVELSSTDRVAYVPDPDELQEIPVVSAMKLTEGYITSAEQDSLLTVSWAAVPDAAYYVLCVLDSSNNILQHDILKAEINEWEFPEFQGAAIMLLCYQDMGEDSAEDDVLIGKYIERFAPEVTATPGPSDAVSSTPSPTVSSVPKNKYKIIVDKEDHAFSAFTYDKNGEYTEKVVTFPCALGKSSRMTPTGTFKISNKGRWKAWYGDKFSPYYTRYTSGLYFHGPIYDEKDGSTLLPESYEEIGTNASAGCVRTTTAGAYWVYAFCPAGTVVEIVKSSDLVSWPGKPAIDPNFPTWDPTDPNKPDAPETTASPSATISAAEPVTPSEAPATSGTDPVESQALVLPGLKQIYYLKFILEGECI